MDMTNYSQLEKELKFIIEQSQDSVFNVIKFILFGGGFFLFYLFTISLGAILTRFPISPSWAETLFIIFSMLTVPTILIVGIWYIIELRSRKLKEFLNKTICLFDTYKDWSVGISDIDTILNRTTEIHETLLWVHAFLRKNKNKFGTDLIRYVQDIEKVTLDTLLNFRSDLDVRMLEKQNTLEGVKYELEKIEQATVLGINESGLKQISELQKIRLDKQIEQFEKLQRVLVQV